MCDVTVSTDRLCCLAAIFMTFGQHGGTLLRIRIRPRVLASVVYKLKKFFLTLPMCDLFVMTNVRKNTTHTIGWMYVQPSPCGVGGYPPML